VRAHTRVVWYADQLSKDCPYPDEQTKLHLQKELGLSRRQSKIMLIYYSSIVNDIECIVQSTLGLALSEVS
jgi:hypothetical protein